MNMLHDKLLELENRRVQYGPLPKGIAPVVSSNDFRADLSTWLRKPVSIDHKLSREGCDRQISTLKSSTKITDLELIISLGTARPAPAYFPWERVSMQAQNPQHREDNPSVISMDCTRGRDCYDLDVAMNYGFAAGSPHLLRFVTEHIELVHDPPYQGWRTALTCGTTSALDIVLRMLCDRGDWILTESVTYPGMMEAARPMGVNLLGIWMDEDGLHPGDMDKKLSSWDSTHGPRPKALYIIPSGQNPSGRTQPGHRRQAIYAIAEKHDLLIIEDDPYYFLQLENKAATLDSYLSDLPRSMLSLDTSGRVIRMDSTSKILAPGLRCGWITACSALIDKFLSFSDFSTTSPSGPSQVMLYKLLDEVWGHEGLLRWLSQLSQRYGHSRDTLLTACTEHLPKAFCKWFVPAFGMFLWVEIDLSSHPRLVLTAPERSHNRPLLKVEDQIYKKARANGVHVSQGSWFDVHQHSRAHLAFRLTFAACNKEALGEGVRRFAEAVRDELGWWT